jgi:sugar lactone lactonase YvrE
LDFPDQYARGDSVVGNAMHDHIALIYEIEQAHSTVQRWNYLTVINRHTGAAQHTPIGSSWIEEEAGDRPEYIISGDPSENPIWPIWIWQYILYYAARIAPSYPDMAYVPPLRQMMIGGAGMWTIDPPVRSLSECGTGVATYVPSTRTVWSGDRDALTIWSESDPLIVISLADAYADYFDPYVHDVLYVPSVDRVYATDIFAPRILVINPETHVIEHVIAAGTEGDHLFAPHPSRMAYDPHRDQVILVRYNVKKKLNSDRRLYHPSFEFDYDTYVGSDLLVIDPHTHTLDASPLLAITDPPGAWQDYPAYQGLIYAPTADRVYLATGMAWQQPYNQEAPPPVLSRVDPDTLAIESTITGTHAEHLTWHQAAQRMYAIDPTQTDALHILALDDLTIDTANSITAALPSLPGSVRLIRPFALLTDYHAGLQYDLGRATLED